MSTARHGMPQRAGEETHEGECGKGNDRRFVVVSHGIERIEPKEREEPKDEGYQVGINVDCGRRSTADPENHQLAAHQSHYAM